MQTPREKFASLKVKGFNCGDSVLTMNVSVSDFGQISVTSDSTV